MKKTALFLLAAVLSTGIQAAPRSLDAARKIAQQQAQKLGLTVANVEQARSLSASAVENQPYYVFNNEGQKGWTIVSGDDRMTDIIGYSDEGEIDMDNLPDAVKDILASFEKKYNNLDTEGYTSVEARRLTGTQTQSAIGPLCPTTWDQYEPYSNLTPVADGKHCATGCVAVAFSQILYYLYHVQAGQDSTTFTKSIPAYTRTGYQVTDAKPGPRTYNWDKMLTDYLGKVYTDEQSNAVAKLMVDVGCAVQMKYAAATGTTPLYFSSTTDSHYVQQYAINYFGLDASAVYVSTPASVDAYFTAVDAELNTYHPVQVAGNGHAFVCDGRDASGKYYHFNFGYDGCGNGFYSQDAYDGYGTTMHYTTGLRIAGDPATPATAVDKLKVVYNSAYAVAANEPVGGTPGYYRQDYYDELETLMAKAKDAINGLITMSDDEMIALGEEISTAEQKMVDYRTPYPTGTYYLKNYNETAADVVMYASGTSAKFAPINTTNKNYQWELNYNEEQNAYTIKNVGTGRYINTIGKGAAVGLGTNAALYCEVWQTNRIVDGNTRYENDAWSISYTNTIRPRVSGYRDNDHCYIAMWNADGRAQLTSGDLVGWQSFNEWAEWVPVPIDVDTNPEPEASLQYESLTLKIGETGTNTLTTTSTGALTYTSSNLGVATVDADGVVTAVNSGTATISVKIAKTDEYKTKTVKYTVTVPEDEMVRHDLDSLLEKAETMYTAEELAEAKAAYKVIVGTTGIITATSQFSSPYTETSEGSLNNLLDGKSTTFWHSKWSGGSVTPGTHYFEVELNDPVDCDLMIKMMRRSGTGTTAVNDDHVTRFVIYSSTDGTNYEAVGDTVDFTYTTQGETVTGTFSPSAGCKKLKFVCTATNSNRGYFHMGDFQLYAVTYEYPTEKQQALIELDNAVTAGKAANPARQSHVDNLKSAVDNYAQYLVPTGIDEVQSSQFRVHSSDTYNMSGQRLTAPRKGINIIGGRKVVY